MNKPHPNLLNRQLPSDIRQNVDRTAEMMDRCVNYGTHLIAKCNQASQNKPALAMILLGLHAVEMLDSISVLIRKCCVDPAKALLRCQMEAMFGIEYMAQGDSERKALQYEVTHDHARIDWYKKCDPTTDAGKNLKTHLEKDLAFRDLNLVSLNTTAQIQNLERKLARPEYAPIEVEWQRLRQERHGQICWYSLFDGPKRIEELAQKIGASGLYQLIYRFYSGEIHATNALTSLHVTHDNRPVYQPIRYPTELPMTVQLAASLALRTYRSLIALMLPNEEEAYAIWYKKEIQPVFMSLEEFKICDVGRYLKIPETRTKG